MTPDNDSFNSISGSEDLRLPDDLREPLHRHLAELRERYKKLKWGRPTGFGDRPALIVIDLAKAWTDPDCFPYGSNVDSVVEAASRLLDAARNAQIPVFFTTSPGDPAEPPRPAKKTEVEPDPKDEQRFDLDSRLHRREDEKIIRKNYASAFSGTNLLQNLCSLRIDTLIVAGVSTSHCVYATCRDASASFRVVVGREAVGERCELMHEVNLLDIEIDLADVLPVDEIIRHLAGE